jgi:hypothetical protein
MCIRPLSLHSVSSSNIGAQSIGQQMKKAALIALRVLSAIGTVIGAIALAATQAPEYLILTLICGAVTILTYLLDEPSDPGVQRAPPPQQQAAMQGHSLAVSTLTASSTSSTTLTSRTIAPVVMESSSQQTERSRPPAIDVTSQPHVHSDTTPPDPYARGQLRRRQLEATDEKEQLQEQEQTQAPTQQQKKPERTRSSRAKPKPIQTATLHLEVPDSSASITPQDAHARGELRKRQLPQEEVAAKSATDAPSVTRNLSGEDPSRRATLRKRSAPVKK